MVTLAIGLNMLLSNFCGTSHIFLELWPLPSIFYLFMVKQSTVKVFFIRTFPHNVECGGNNTNNFYR